MIIFWFRQDLRLDDNPGLLVALSQQVPVLPVFIWSPEEENDWPPSDPAKWWLYFSLLDLDRELRKLGSRLTIRRGRAEQELNHLFQQTGARRIIWNRRYEPSIVQRDRRLKQYLDKNNISSQDFNSALLYDPSEIPLAENGHPFQVFSQFWKACANMAQPEQPVDCPANWQVPESWPESLPIEDLASLFSLKDGRHLFHKWQPGATHAAATFQRFQQEAEATYSTERHFPDRTSTSCLAPHIHFGEISLRRIWHALSKKSEAFRKQLGWREFGYYLLHHFPTTPHRSLRPEFDRLLWKDNDRLFDAWRYGRTGYPIVDAGMRQLRATGWMHNRVRMITASLLVKDLQQHWQRGARWFWDTLVDADLASNTLNWQWTAGAGTDKLPLRSFYPLVQGHKFDPDGSYVRRWVPELAALPPEWIHQPFQAPEEVLRAAGVEMEVDYPYPVNVVVPENSAPIHSETPQKSCLIIGAGIAGLAAGRKLQKEGWAVTILDKGRSAGGRLATRFIDEAVFDHGAQFITVRSPAFEELMNSLQQVGIVYEWCRGFGTPKQPYRSDGHPRYQGTGGMGAIGRYLAQGMDVRVRQRVTQLRYSGKSWTAELESGQSLSATSLISTMPVPQALDVLDLGGFEMQDGHRQALDRVKYHPCLALMVLLEGPSQLPAPGALQFPEGPLWFVADNRMKGISPDATAVTIHASVTFSREHWNVSEPVVQEWLLNLASPYLGSKIRSTTLHRWRFAQPVEQHPERCFSIPLEAPLIFAGDAFGEPRVEGAALSGMAAAEELLRFSL